MKTYEIFSNLGGYNSEPWLKEDSSGIYSKVE